MIFDWPHWFRPDRDASAPGAIRERGVSMFKFKSRRESEAEPADSGGQSEPLYTAAASVRRQVEAKYDEWLRKARKTGKWTDFVVITPAMAELLLEHNPENRPVPATAEARLSADMKDGNFQTNGESVIIAITGELNDGQTRLKACIKSGKPFETVLVVGVPRNTRETLDQGTRRTPGQQLHMLGYSDGNNLGHAARVLWQLNTYQRVSQSPDHQPTWPQRLETINGTPGLAGRLGLGRRAWKGRLGGAGLFAALYEWCAQRVGDAEAEKFFEPLVSGIDIKAGSPIAKLRERLQDPASKRLTPAERALLTVKCWNAWRRGEGMRRLILVPGEDFPEAE